MKTRRTIALCPAPPSQHLLHFLRYLIDPRIPVPLDGVETPVHGRPAADTGELMLVGPTAHLRVELYVSGVGFRSRHAHLARKTTVRWKVMNA